MDWGTVMIAMRGTGRLLVSDDAWWDGEEASKGKEVRTLCGGLMTVPSPTALSQPLHQKKLLIRAPPYSPR